jgi:hypothetical protein
MTKARPEEEAALDAYGPVFMQAYERAKSLKQVLQELKPSDGQRVEKALEALDLFLKAGAELEQAAKQRTRSRAVERVTREIKEALRWMERTAHDQRMELEALEDIERAIKDMKKRIQERPDRR